MTTEIAVINRLGVALAADSAVTIPGYGGDKVFNTGDKLFELSEYCPVALMINGSMDFLGVPWEVIAKDFRRHPPPKAESLTIRQWMDCFLAFIANHSTVKKDDIRRWLDELIREELSDLTETVRDRLNEVAANDGSENVQDALRRLFLETAQKRVVTLARQGTIDSRTLLAKIARDSRSGHNGSLIDASADVALKG
jgi:hypothetical protein